MVKNTRLTLPKKKQTMNLELKEWEERIAEAAEECSAPLTDAQISPALCSRSTKPTNNNICTRV